MTGRQVLEVLSKLSDADLDLPVLLTDGLRGVVGSTYEDCEAYDIKRVAECGARAASPLRSVSGLKPADYIAISVRP